MPEENYGLCAPAHRRKYVHWATGRARRPVQLSLWRSQAKVQKNPSAGTDLQKLPTKADLLKALNDAFAYCDGADAALTDMLRLEVIDITQERQADAQHAHGPVDPQLWP